MNITNHFGMIYKTKKNHISQNIFLSYLEKNSIEDWIFYKELEDLSFYRGKDESSCLFRSVSHEEFSWINWNNKKEYKYLKSIGIKIRGDGSKPVKLE